jgi:hypothetical protein
MYKTPSSRQATFEDFNQSCGMKLDPSNEWCLLAARIPWAKWEARYAALFPSGRGRPAIPLRIALGALLIQKREHLSDRRLVRSIAENPYLQYFLGLPAFASSAPFKPTVLVNFRKRLTAEFLQAVNEDILADAPSTPEHASKPRGRKRANPATLILDATCSPDEIRPPHDSTLLEEARLATEEAIDALHRQFPAEGHRPRTYRRVLRKAYLSFSRARKRPAGAAHDLCGKLLGALRRNLAFIDAFLAKGGTLDERTLARLDTIRQVYAQQLEMHRTGHRSVPRRIVSLSKPWLRPIVRGKVRTPVEFGPKYEVSIDEKGHARLEKLQFEAYNECHTLQTAAQRYHDRCGHWPKRILADQIYRTHDNRTWCEARGIHLSGRPPSRTPPTRAERLAGRQEDAERNEVERLFSRAKRTCGAGLLQLRLEPTTLAAVALSILVSNLFGIRWNLFFVFHLADIPDAPPGLLAYPPALLELHPPIS